MKASKKIFAWALISIITLGLNSNFIDSSAEEQQDDCIEYDFAYDISNYEDIYEGYNDMINSFAYECVFASRTRTLNQNNQIAEIEIDYPDNYAGACYNADGDGKIDIYLTDDQKENYTAFFESDEIDFHKVDFTLDELIEAKNKINPYMHDYNIEGLGIYQKENTIKISYNENFSEPAFNELLDELNINRDMINIFREDKFTDTAATVPAGSRIEINQYGTVGFNAYRPQTAQYGIVTAGHLFTDVSNATTIRDSSNRVINTRGSTVVYHNANDNVDCAFIPFNGSYGWRTTTNYSNSGYTGYVVGSVYVNSTLEGTPVVKYGANTGRETGEIISISYDGNMGGLYKYDYIHCSNRNKGGDSGGPIGIESNGELTLVALTCNRNYYYSNEEGQTFGCKLTNVFGKLGVNISYK